MENSKQKLSIRWFYLGVGVVAMLFAGIIYAWSILKDPLAAEFGWQDTDLALNFTLTMCFFCVGAFLGGLVSKRIGTRISIIVPGLVAAAGLILTSRIASGNVVQLYVAYGVMAGIGIGMSYNVILSTVSAVLRGAAYGLRGQRSGAGQSGGQLHPEPRRWLARRLLHPGRGLGRGDGPGGAAPP